MLDLGGALEKVKRAKKHIADLSIEKAVFLSEEPYAATPEFYPDTGRTVYFMDKFTDPPPAIALIAGDAAHNLRSALDFLACALIRKNDRTPSPHIYFPICESFEKYESDAERKVQGMHRSDIEAIGKLKPYGGGNDALWGLHRMDIVDKHNLLMTPIMAIDKIGFEVGTEIVEREFKGLIRFSDKEAVTSQTFWFPFPNSLTASKVGDPIGAIGGSFEMQHKAKFTFDIALGEPEVFKGRPILETLHQLADLVEGIVDSFKQPEYYEGGEACQPPKPPNPNKPKRINLA